MIDVFNIKVYWGARKESVTECSKKLEILFEKLKERKSFFSDWQLTGSSKKEALSSKFDHENIETFLRKENSKELDSMGFSEIGISFSLYKRDEQENDYGLSFSGGYGKDLFPNNFLLSFWDPNRFDKEEILELFTLIIHCLNPEWGCIDSNGLLDNVGRSKNRIGWVSLLPSNLLNKLPKDIVKQKVNDNLSLFYLDGENWFDYSEIKSIKVLYQEYVGSLS